MSGHLFFCTILFDFKGSYPFFPLLNSIHKPRRIYLLLSNNNLIQYLKTRQREVFNIKCKRAGKSSNKKLENDRRQVKLSL